MKQTPPPSLDPDDWNALRQQGHQMLDDMFDYIAHIRQRPVWQPIPADVRQAFDAPLPHAATPLAQAHARFMTQVLPYAAGNSHPRFMGWVQGGGTPVGMLAEMLAAGLNANLGGRDQMALEVERQIVHWMRDLFGFPDAASGLFVTGSSTANLMGVLVARTRALGVAARASGLGSASPLVAYAACTAHSCISKAMEICGLGTQALRLIAVNPQDQIDTNALVQQMAADRAAGLQPFLLMGTAGTVNTGAIDDLDTLADIARQAQVWFHVDGALGALGMLAPDIAPRLKGIERADSLALDFHKWGQVPYDAGFFMVRDGASQTDTFATPAAYLTRHTRGLGAGSPWPCDLGFDLSRSFRALKTWFTLVCYGTDHIGAVISNTCALAQTMQQRLADYPDLELMAPVALNIVCFRFRAADVDVDVDALNAELVADLHESGIAVPSVSSVRGHTVIRTAIVNHRTQASDIDALLQAAQTLGRQRLAAASASPATHPTPPPATQPPLIGLATCFRMGFEGQLLMPLADTLLQRAHANAQDANALMDLSVLLQLQGLREEGLRTLALALHIQRLYTLPAELPSRLTLLAIMTAGDLMANAPLPFLFEHADITLHMLYLLPGEPLPTTLPAHDVAFIAISDASRTRGLLQQLTAVLPAWPRPVLNAPEGILRTSRLMAFDVLKDAPGVAMAPTVQVTRAQLQQACASAGVALAALLANADFPVIIRPIDSHAGHGLEKIDDWAGLTQYLATQTEDAFYLSHFMDYRSADGLFRKYRVVLVGGVAFAGHMGISNHWMIHYLNAGMTDSAEKRAEEAAFMQHFDTDFAQRHQAALHSIHARFGLAYLVLDCAETATGELLVFELDPGAVVHSMDPPEQFGYKHPAMQKVFAAFRALLLKTAQG